MGDGILSPATTTGNPFDFFMDFDYIDELLLEGCWLGTTDGSEFPRQIPSNTSALFDPSFGWAATAMETNGNMNMNPTQNDDHEEGGRPFLNEPHVNNTEKALSLNEYMDDVAGCSSQSEKYTVEGFSDMGRRWWIGPRAYPGPASSVIDRLIWAIGSVKDSERDKDMLVQVWVPENRGVRRVLATSDLPFSVNTSCQRLARYRDISVNYQFSAEEDCKEAVGLPSRVFLGKVPEWTPDVQFFRSDEYARVDYAQEYGVRGTLALPVFERGSRTCLGVIEVVLTTQQIKYNSELKIMCKALEAVDLSSSTILSSPNVKALNRSYQAVLPEILEILRFACETHKLPLAQTWVSCLQQGREGCRHSEENYINCISTVDQACYVADPHFQSFHEVCSEHHLLKGQGVAGEAFMANGPIFLNDITSFGNTEYPLSHHARMFELHAAVAIRLRSIHTSKADFVLEFFLPVDCIDPEKQKKMLQSLSIIIQESCKSLRVITDGELREETSLLLDRRELEANVNDAPLDKNPETASVMHIQEHGGGAVPFSPDKKPEVLTEDSPGFQLQQQNTNFKGFVESIEEECSTFCEGSLSNASMGKTGEKKRVKAEKTITLQVLRQHFAGSLKDAAKSLGVCPTTLKRICRQHGITRWPSRKIKKVGHSLQKLQLVIDSVQGSSASFQIGSLYTNFSDLASPNLSRTSPFSTSVKGDHQTASNIQQDGSMINARTAASKSLSSSGSQSSSSSQCCSSRAQQNHPHWNDIEDRVVGENSGVGQLKRARSEAEQNTTNQGLENRLLRCQSHKALCERPSPENLVQISKSSGRLSEEEDVQRVKVIYEDEKIRFRMANSWGFKDLLMEIARRFSIQDIGKFDIKYLDDDSEWVLLTCDADLEECIDVYRSSLSQTIKLSIQLARHHARSL